MEREDVAVNAEVEAVAEPVPLKLERVRAFQQRVFAEQNLLLGSVAGMGAALVGAVIWAVITVVVKIQIGWMAVGVGVLAGMSVRVFGNGVTRKFGVVGALSALAGCLLGNLFSVCAFLALEHDASVVRVVFRALGHPAAMVELMRLTFSPIDLLFYGFAVYGGYKASFREITPRELAALRG
jgi:ascorbate-specific PTS system EIIC-type component UlaA